MKESIYKFFEEELKMYYWEKWEEIVQAVLSDKNSYHFVNVLGIAKDAYQKEVAKRESELIDIEDWNVPPILSFGSAYTKKILKKSIMQPFLNDERWKTEAAFIEFLEKSPSVEWWFKSGDRDTTFFAVPYKNGEDKPFYIDFIVKLKDGRMGLFDTKTGLTLKVAGPKIEGVYNYIKTENQKGKNLFGGIVTNTDQRNYRGRWLYFTKARKEFKEETVDNWETLEL